MLGPWWLTEPFLHALSTHSAHPLAAASSSSFRVQLKCHLQSAGSLTTPSLTSRFPYKEVFWKTDREELTLWGLDVHYDTFESFAAV